MESLFKFSLTGSLFFFLTPPPPNAARKKMSCLLLLMVFRVSETSSGMFCLRSPKHTHCKPALREVLRFHLVLFWMTMRRNWELLWTLICMIDFYHITSKTRGRFYQTYVLLSCFTTFLMSCLTKCMDLWWVQLWDVSYANRACVNTGPVVLISTKNFMYIK